MNQPPAIRFLPPSIIWLGVATWIALTVFACNVLLPGNEKYPPLVVTFGIAMTSLSMACVAAWAALLLMLVVNWSVNNRRTLFRKALLAWTAFFGFVTALGVWSVLFLDS